MRMPIKLTPQEFIDLYDLNSKANKGYIYTRIQKATYGLSQVGTLANKLVREDQVMRGERYCHNKFNFFLLNK